MMLKTLHKGMNEIDVAIAKYMLGYADVKMADNEFNNEFYSFVCEYQEKNKLTADGIIGEKTWQKIAANAPLTSYTKNRKSRETCAIQLLLGIEADGIFGLKTRNAVKEYQKDNGLENDGKVGKNTWSLLILGKEAAASEGLNPNPIKPIDFKQYDSRWGSKMYSNHGDKSQTMKSSACGPTSVSMIIHQWWDNTVTPYTVAMEALDKGYRTNNSGTSGGFMKYVANKYKASKYQTTSNIDAAIKCLNEGGYVVVCFGPGTKGKPWYQLHTKGGHYCLLWKWDGTYFYINDPASAAAKRAKSGYDDVKDCRKGFYCFWR